MQLVFYQYFYNMFGGLYNIIFTDYSGRAADTYFLQHAGWLTNSAVSSHIYLKNGRWKINITFGWGSNPIQLICRYIALDFDTMKKASLYANNYVRTCQKDKRGNLILTADDFNINFN